jgi:CubicO group peptidase (beta-lactamase class C family)
VLVTLSGSTWSPRPAHRSEAQTPCRDAAIVAAIAADDQGYSVDLSEGCAPDGRFEISSRTKTMTGVVFASLVDDGIVGFR